MAIQSEQIQQLGAAIPHCMRGQQRGFRNRLKRMRLRLKQAKDIQVGFGKLQRDIEQSCQMLEARKQRLPEIVYPEDLPISQKRQWIADAIEKHQVVIVAGETGSGKTTQIPKICLSLGRGIHAMIGHTQPRRIAARSVATRIAEELASPLGTDVGYKVRFSDHSRNFPYIKLMTDGILLAEIQRDPKLLHYDTIIVDEAHERSLNIDFLLGYLKNILPTRPDLKLIVTSATINTARFSAFFNQAPIIEVSGRSYPVDIVYRPVVSEQGAGGRSSEHGDAQTTAFHQAVMAAVDVAADMDPLGDILIFLPGEREIRDTALALHQHSMRDTEILPLYSRLSPAEQDRVFKGHRGRRIVLATNVAETSLTVPGIRFVIDSGLARISRYSARSKVQRLPIEPISQASANQRAGRCGRVAAGVCFRLYSEADFKLRAEHTDPEIRRTHLASVILQMANLGLGRIHDFTFMEPPEKRAIGDGYRLLEELQAIEGESLTAIGKLLVRLPLDPRLGRMLLQAEKEGVVHEVAIIVSALSIQDPRLRPADMAQQADAKHRLFRDDSSDFMSWLKLWHWYHEQSHHLSRSKLKKTCQQHYLAYMRMREWHDLHGQLLSVMAELKLQSNAPSGEQGKRTAAKPESVHRAMLAGLLSHIAMRHPEKGYMGARNLKLTIFPASVLAKKPPTWLMAASLVETSRLFARDIAPIDPRWLESLAAHLLKRQYSEPHWSAKRAQVNAFEKISLYGLPIVSGRRCHYGPIDAELSRQLFIRHALVQHELHTHGDFFKHNKRIITEIEAMEHKTRRKDLLADEQARYDFFDARIPAGIYSGKLFEQWRKQAESQQPRLLFLDKAILLQGQADGVDAELFPNRLQLAQLKLRVSYHFDPGHQADGITVHVPMLALGQLDAARFEWLVPGMLVEKLTLLIRGLPKAMRKNFVPAPQFAEACADSMVFADGALLRAFSKELLRMTGVEVPTRLWNSDGLPAHLRMNFSVLDEHGSSMDEGMNLALLQQRYAGQMRTALQEHPSAEDIRRTGITRWDFDGLPECVEQRQGRSMLQYFPALVDHQNSVAIEWLESRQAADAAMRAGVRRLLMLSLNTQVKMLQKSFSKNKEIVLYYKLLGHKSHLIDDIIFQAFDGVFMAPESTRANVEACTALPRRRADFEHLLQTRKSRLVAQAEQVASQVQAIFKAHASLQQQMAAIRAPALKPVVADIQAQLAEMMPDGFVRLTPFDHLQHLPRYIDAAAVRLGRAGPNLKQDQANSQIMQEFWQAYQAEYLQRQQHHEDGDGLNAFRWLLEELRVSLFAQSLKTATPVSVKRLRKHWQELALGSVHSRFV